MTALTQILRKALTASHQRSRAARGSRPALLRSILPPVLSERVDRDSVQLRSGSYVDAKLKGLASGAQALRTLFGNLSIVSGRDEGLVHPVMEHLSQPVREDFMELEEMLAQKKLEQGRAEGRAQGRAEGGAAML